MITKKHRKSISFISPFAYPLMVPGGHGPGGAERQLLLFGRGLSNKGWNVSFITDHPSDEYNKFDTLLPVYPCSFSYMGGSNLRIPVDWASLFFAMKKADSEYYVIKVPGHLLAPMAIFCRLFNRKIVFWGQMSFDANPGLRNLNSFAGLLQDWGVKHADIVIAQTREQQSGFLKNYGIHSKIVPSIATQLNGPKKENKLSKKPRKIDVLWAGNSEPKKRYEVIVELAKLMPEIKFALAMNMSNKKRFEQALNDCENLSNIDFLGTVPPSEMEDIFKQTKIFLNTSTQEGFPNTYLQSWMNGIPVVSLNIDPDNVISDNNLGRVVSKEISQKNEGSFERLAALSMPYIKELLENEIIREQISENAKNYIFEKHSPEKVVLLLESILKQ